jgi:hypothetical protein
MGVTGIKIDRWMDERTNGWMGGWVRGPVGRQAGLNKPVIILKHSKASLIQLQLIRFEI